MQGAQAHFFEDEYVVRRDGFEQDHAVIIVA